MSDDLLNDFEAVSKKLNIDVDILRDISPAEIQYLLDHCPFLQIVDTVLHYIGETPPEVQFVDAQSGWRILDYGDAMSSSPGEKILGFAEYKRIKDDGEEDGGGQGTIWNQAFITAIEMVELAHLHGWKGIQIVDGHRLMKRGAWIKASQLGLPVVGFEPTEKDEKIRERIDMSPNEYELLRHKAKNNKNR